MAANFRISRRRDRSVLHVRLSGDFDGSSAFELLQNIKNDCKGMTKVIIDTNGLRDIDPFGKYMFQKNICVLNDFRLKLRLLTRICA